MRYIMATDMPSNGSAPRTKPVAATEHYPVYLAGPVASAPDEYCLWVECLEVLSTSTILAGVLFTTEYRRRLYLPPGGEIKLIRQVGWARRGDLSRMEDVFDRFNGEAGLGAPSAPEEGPPSRLCCFAAAFRNEGLLLPLDPEDETRAAVSPAEDKE